MARTNIELDDKLIREGMKLTGIQTKRELVHAALESFIKKQRLKDYFEGISGALNTKGRLSKKLLEERARERRLEGHR
jgi:Arc/MetJ family transcription regulator